MNVEQSAITDPSIMLEKIRNLPIYKWSWKSRRRRHVEHIGPTAQDFKQTFGFGNSDKHIDTGDAVGILLVAVAALSEQVESLETRLFELEQNVERNRTRLEHGQRGSLDTTAAD